MNSPARAPSVVRGIFYMVLMTLLFASMNAAARHVSAGLHPFEVAFFRNLFAVLFVAPLLMRNGLAVFHTRRFGGHFARAAFNTLAEHRAEEAERLAHSLKGLAGTLGAAPLQTTAAAAEAAVAAGNPSAIETALTALERCLAQAVAEIESFLAGRPSPAT